MFFAWIVIGAGVAIISIIFLVGFCVGQVSVTRQVRVQNFVDRLMATSMAWFAGQPGQIDFFHQSLGSSTWAIPMADGIPSLCMGVLPSATAIAGMAARQRALRA